MIARVMPMSLPRHYARFGTNAPSMAVVFSDTYRNRANSRVRFEDTVRIEDTKRPGPIERHRVG